MTGESTPNPKKFKTDSELKDDGRITITISQDASSQDSRYGTYIEDGFFFIELQGEKSVDRKLNRVFTIGDRVVLLKNIPEEHFYTGYLCTIIGVLGEEESPEKSFYEIQFDSSFENNDLSRRSKKRHRDFEFPVSVYVTVVSGKDIVRLINQDLYYQTSF